MVRGFHFSNRVLSQKRDLQQERQETVGVIRLIWEITLFLSRSLSQVGHQRLQNASGGQRPLVPEPARPLQGHGAQTPQRVGERAGQGQEVCF